MKKIVSLVNLFLLAAILAVSAGEKKEVHILSANDMHAAMECFPRLGFIADSLRALYPDLLILSAGDNRSGDPLNDMYEIPAYPMVALMNQVGFHATTLGNHEFDSGQEGLARLVDLSAFPTLCANVHPDPKWKMHLKPYQKFDVGGLAVGVIGVVQLGTLGIPESLPIRMTDISFSDPLETIKKYEFLRKECDVVVLLSHLGYNTEVAFSAELPWVDIIVGGHSHTQIEGGEMHNGILITQNGKSLPRVTHSTLVLEDGKVVDKTAENIFVRGESNESVVVKELVRFFSENPAFDRVLAVADTPFDTREELGCLMTDAYRTIAGADVAYQNLGGVRYNSKPTGDFTVRDVFMLDPFLNPLMVANVTGKDLVEMLIECYKNDKQRIACVSGMRAEYTLDPSTKDIKKLVLYDMNGKKLNPKKNYKLAVNAYGLSAAPTNRTDMGHATDKVTSDAIIEYLKQQGHVSYQGVERIVKNYK